MNSGLELRNGNVSWMSEAEWITNGTIHQGTEWRRALLAPLLGLLCLVTVCGNALVVAAIFRERRLRTVANYLLASLAAADLLVGGAVMPLSAAHEALGHWPLGRDMCDVYRSLDVLASTASILNLCAISLDRYWAVSDPIAYPGRMTTATALALIAAVWLSSALLSFPAIAWWRASSTSEPPPNSCFFTEDVTYLLFSSLVSFYAPLVAMCLVYCRVYRAASNQRKSLRTGTKHVGCELTLRIHRGGSPRTALSSRPSVGKRLTRLAKERKAAKTLGIVMGAFVLCWAPFFVTNVLIGVCGRSCVFQADILSSVFSWLGWINSAMNPVIYACRSRDFRLAFSRLVRSRHTPASPPKKKPTEEAV